MGLMALNLAILRLVLENNYAVLLAYGSRCSVGVSSLIGCSLNADVNIVLADDGDWLVVANVAVKRFEFQVVTVYTSNISAERVFFFRGLALAPFLNDPKRIVLMGDWKAIPDPKIDMVGRGARVSGRCESSLIDFMTWLTGFVWITQGGRCGRG